MNISYQIPDPDEETRNYGDFPISSSIVSGLVFILDSLGILAFGFLTTYILIGLASDNLIFYVSAVLFIWVANFMFFNFAGLYKFDTIIDPMKNWDRLIVAYAVSFLMLVAVAFSYKVSAIYSRVWVYSFAFSTGMGIVIFRLCLSHIVNNLATKGYFVRNVVIVGGGEQGKRLLDHIKQTSPRFLKIVGVFDDRANLSGVTVAGFSIRGNLSDLVKYVRNHRVDDVIVALPWSAEESLKWIIKRLRQLPVNIYLGSDLIGFHTNLNACPSHFSGMPMVEVIDKPISGWSTVFKFLEDIILASLALIFLSPLMVLIAIAIRLDSPGPVLFRQQRLGFNNRVFNVYKFRSMKENSRETNGKTAQAVHGDVRVTRIGRFLRRTSLDELPQLFNVFNGTMSIVGPRPHAVDHNEEYSKKIYGYFARHRVKPGITGWAQVNGLRGEIKSIDKMEQRVEHDIHYAENWSLIFDFKIILKTIRVIITGENAY
jgi:Undecaprenyl-phosphate glucose phosphotransferase